MQDDEYPAYLKKQSYNNLVSIRCSIDHEAQAKRYELVLAELAERDKRGEKPETNWQGNATLALGGFFLVEFVLDLILSRTGWKPVIHLTLGIVVFMAAWFGRKKGKNEKPAA